MVSNQQYAPTKSNLNRLKEELIFAKQGYDLLDQKRTILIAELMQMIGEAVEFEKKADRALDEAYKSLRRSVISYGRLKASSLALSVNIESEIKVGSRHIMGVSIPSVITHFKDNPPYYSGYNVGIMLDEAVLSFKAVVQLMGKLAEFKIGIMRLAQEVKQTIRKVNALDKVVIPNTKKQVSIIEAHLEENERDMLVLMKSVKHYLEVEK